MVRIKYRYAVVELCPFTSEDSCKSFSSFKLHECLTQNIQKLHGDFGSALSNGFKIQYCNEKTRIAIIRARHGSHRYITSTIPLLTVICGIRAKFRTIYVGATIKNCYKCIVRHHQNTLDRMFGQIKGNKDEFIQEIIKISNIK